MARCRSCPAPILWAPVVRTLKKGEGETLPGIDAPPRYKTHFATCPNAGRHRQ